MRKLSFFACLLALGAIPLANGQTFQNQDVGGPAIEGSTEVSGNEITVTGAGNDIWGNSDQFQFYYTTLVGDFDVSVRVDGLEGTHQWAKAELMIRSSGNSEEPRGGDPHISMMATRDGGQNNISPQWRKVRGGGSGWDGGNVVTPVPYPDVHFRMTKVGSLITGYFSEDGSDWTKMYEADTSDPDFDVIGQGGTWGNGVDFNSSPVYVGLAVTSHDVNSEATAWFYDLEFTGDVTPAVPVVATITEQPENAEVTTGSSASFSVTVDNTFPTPTFQWTKNGTDIDGATGTTYTIDRAALADNGANFAVKVTNSEGTITSNNAALTVTADNEPPTLASASGTGTFTTVRVVFSEPLDEASAETPGNYALSGGVTVSAAALAAEAGTAGDDTVVLTTSRQPEGTVLTLTVNNVKDAAGDNAIAASSTIDFKTHVWVNGFVLYKRWDQINTRVPGIGPHSDPDETFRELETLDAFPDNPDVVSLRPLWEAVTDSNELNEYAAQISGWITPAETTGYVFFTNSDDPSHLYLSPDDDPANKLLIAQQVQWSGARQWHAGNALLKRSDEFGNNYPTEATDSEHEYDIWDDDDLTSVYGIPLEAGQRYYMESVHREGGGGGNVQATMITENEAGEEGFPANGTASTLTGDLIGTYLNPNGAEVTITNQPSEATVISGLTATFSVVAGATSAYGNAIDYQWQSADAGSSEFADIEGATADSYTTDPLLQGDNGRQYRVVIGAPLAQLHSVNSDAATLTVNPDEVLPEIVSVFPLQRNNVVVVLFDERLDESSAETAGNYTISGASISAAELVGDGGNVVKLTVSGTPSADFTVTATGVQDFSGNAITSSEGVAVTSDVVVYWDFDDAGDETTATDLVRSAVGELEGDAVFTDDRGGRSGQAGDRAVDLGTYGGGQHVLVEPANWLNGYPAQLNQITFSFWQKWTENINNQSSFWAVSTGSSSGNRGAQAHTPWGNGEIYFDTAGCCGGATQRINLASGFDQVDWEEWHHFAFVKDGDYKAIYVDGDLLHEGNNTNPLPADFVRLMIGSDGGGGNSHGGLIDDFAVFTTPLSMADIGELADGMRPDEIRTIVPIIDPSGLSISVRLNGDGTVTLVFTGTLHSSDSITGTFVPVEGSTSPYTVSIVPGNAPPPIPGQPAPQPTPVDPQKFYLVR